MRTKISAVFMLLSCIAVGRMKEGSERRIKLAATISASHSAD